MGWRDEISEVVQPNNLTPSLTYWINILNFAEQHMDELSLADLEYLAYESERCRNYWNKDHKEIKTITKNGKDVEQPVIRKGLGIKQEDVYPNIHDMIEQKLEVIRQEELEEETPPEEKKSHFVPKLAAMSH